MRGLATFSTCQLFSCASAADPNDGILNFNSDFISTNGVFDDVSSDAVVERERDMDGGIQDIAGVVVEQSEIDEDERAAEVNFTAMFERIAAQRESFVSVSLLSDNPYEFQSDLAFYGANQSWANVTSVRSLSATTPDAKHVVSDDEGDVEGDGGYAQKNHFKHFFLQ